LNKFSETELLLSQHTGRTTAISLYDLNFKKY
jgi:hypothetical protein